MRFYGEGLRDDGYGIVERMELAILAGFVLLPPLATLLLTGALCALLRARRASASSDRAGIAFACLGGAMLALASLGAIVSLSSRVGPRSGAVSAQTRPMRTRQTSGPSSR